MGTGLSVGRIEGHAAQLVPQSSASKGRQERQQAQGEGDEDDQRRRGRRPTEGLAERHACLLWSHESDRRQMDAHCPRSSAEEARQRDRTEGC